MLFNTHIDVMCKKVTGTLLYINGIKDRFDIATRTLIVKSLALSLINYCSLVWGMANRTQLDRVQKLQNFASKVAIGARKYDHVTPILKQLTWLKIEDNILYDVSVLVFKILRNYFPDWLFTLQTVGETRNILTRQINDLVVPRVTTDYGNRILTVKGPRIWNELPVNVREEHTLPSFKRKLKAHILNK